MLTIPRHPGLPLTTRGEGTTVSDPQPGIFGIDLGTTYSVVGYIDETGRPAVTRNSYGDDTTPVGGLLREP